MGNRHPASFAKRQREAAKRAKRAEKAEKKAARKAEQDGGAEATDIEGTQDDPTIAWDEAFDPNSLGDDGKKEGDAPAEES